MHLRMGVDVDGVLCDHVSAICTRVRDLYGIELSPGMVTEWDFRFGPSSIARELRAAYADRAFLLSLAPVCGSQAAVLRIGAIAGVEVLAVTSRPSAMRVATAKWLAQHFPGMRLRHSSHRERLPLDVLVDDYVPFVERFALAGRMGILFSQPWNANERERLCAMSGIRVARDWDDVVSLIASLAGAR